MGDAFESSSLELVGVETEFVECSQFCDNDGNAFVSNGIISQNQRLDVLKGGQQLHVFISDVLFGQVYFFGFFGDCDIFDGDEGDRPVLYLRLDGFLGALMF